MLAMRHGNRLKLREAQRNEEIREISCPCDGVEDQRPR